MPEDRPRVRPLSGILAIEPAGEDAFEAELDGFGGRTLGCAALAAARTRPDRGLHALHAWFLRPVRPDTRARLAVERVRDGRLVARMAQEQLVS